MGMSVIIRILAIALLVAIPALEATRPVAACSCSGPTAAFTHSTGAFTGRLVAIGDEDGNLIEDGDSSNRARSFAFEVETAYKGDVQPLMVMHGSTGSCGTSPGVKAGDLSGIMFFTGDNGEPRINLCTETTPEFLKTVAERTGFDGHQVSYEPGQEVLSPEVEIALAAASLSPESELTEPQSPGGTGSSAYILTGTLTLVGLLVLAIGIRKWRTGVFIR